MNHQPSTIEIWLIAARPKTLWAGVAPVLVGTGMAYADGGFHWLAALGALTFALLIQIGTNFCNDYADFKKGADTEEREGPLRVTQAGLVSSRAILSATAIVFTLAALIGVCLVARVGWPFLVLLVLCVLSGIAYTAGPFPLGYNGLGDVFVLIFFGPIAVFGTYLVQTRAFDFSVIIAGLSPGLLSVAILVVNNLRDADNDAKSGKRTLVVRFGKTFARIQYVLCILIAALIPVALVAGSGSHFWSLASLLVLPASIPAIRKVFAVSGVALNPVLAQTARLLLLHSTLFSVGWAIL
ncbi:MAG: 1,4-dihydroxy-2-naphthoate polyprenyltransferase [Verrucomicrobia bacterium]|nr:1,4-dihydroxy-2-naphthoate polyprenyltransferase [Verrucomicrobiota bacterium]